MQYEYKIINAVYGEDLTRHDEGTLNRLGMNGWELINVVNIFRERDQISNGAVMLPAGYKFILKRVIDNIDKK